MPRPHPRIMSVRGLILLVAFVAVVLPGYVSNYKARERERRLLDELHAERVRAQGYQRLARMAIVPNGSSAVDLRRELDEEAGRFQAEATRRRLGTKEATR